MLQPSSQRSYFMQGNEKFLNAGSRKNLKARRLDLSITININLHIQVTEHNTSIRTEDHLTPEHMEVGRRSSMPAFHTCRICC